jgi:hypothetical protein
VICASKDPSCADAPHVSSRASNSDAVIAYCASG